MSARLPASVDGFSLYDPPCFQCRGEGGSRLSPCSRCRGGGRERDAQAIEAAVDRLPSPEEGVMEHSAKPKKRNGVSVVPLDVAWNHLFGPIPSPGAES